MERVARGIFGFVAMSALVTPGCATRSTHEAPEYYLFRPAVEKAYGYTHAVRVGDHVKISGAVTRSRASLAHHIIRIY